MSRHLRLLLLLPLLLLTGCAALRPDPPEVQLAGLTISDLSLSHANFLATLSVYNPNRAELEVEGLEFALFLDDIRFAAGKTAKVLLIPAEQSGQAALRLSTSFIDLFRISRRFNGRTEVPFRIAGEIRIGGPGFTWITVPIESAGTIPLGGALDELLTTPEEFWREPERLFHNDAGRPGTTPPAGR